MTLVRYGDREQERRPDTPSPPAPQGERAGDREQLASTLGNQAVQRIAGGEQGPAARNLVAGAPMSVARAAAEDLEGADAANAAHVIPDGQEPSSLPDNRPPAHDDGDSPPPEHAAQSAGAAGSSEQTVQSAGGSGSSAGAAGASESAQAPEEAGLFED